MIKTFEVFYEKELQKTDPPEFRVKDVIKKEVNYQAHNQEIFRAGEFSRN